MAGDELLPPIKREGEVVSSHGRLLGGTQLVVALDDGRLLDVPLEDVKVSR